MLLFLPFFSFLLKCKGFFTFFPAHINHIHARYKVGDSFYDPYIAKVVCSISLKWCHFPPIIASPLPPSSHLSSISSFPALLPLDAGLPSHPPIYTRKTARIDTHTAHVGGSASSFPYSPYYPLLLTNFTFFILSLLQKIKMKQQHARPLEHALVELWWLTSPMPNVNRVCSRPLTKLQTSIPQPLW